MKNIESLLAQKLEKLANIYNNTGVLPSDTVDSIFDPKYHKIVLHNSGRSIVAEFEFTDELNDIVTMRYTYGIDRYLNRIEEVQSDGVLVIWDRDETLHSLLLDVKELLRSSKKSSEVDKIFSTLPPVLREEFTRRQHPAAVV